MTKPILVLVAYTIVWVFLVFSRVLKMTFLDPDNAPDLYFMVIETDPA